MTNAGTPTDHAGTCGGFPPTRDSLILRLTGSDNDQARQALSTLCEIYREPVRRWLALRGTNQESAEDLAQDFMAYLLEENRFVNYVRTKAKFRSFLIECLKRFCRGEWRKEVTEKRGGLAVHVPLSDDESAAQLDMERIVDVEFAVAVHRRAMKRLEERYEAAGKAGRFDELRRFILRDDPSVTYAMAAQPLGITPNAVKKAVFDLRDAYLEQFRSEVADTASGEALDEELRYLVSLLAEAEVPS